MSQPSDDSPFDRRAAELARRYRQLPVDRVPADLDRLILDHARAALAAPAKPRRWWIHWGLPLGFIGSALLAATLVLDDTREPAAFAEDAGSVQPVPPLEVQPVEVQPVEVQPVDAQPGAAQPAASLSAASHAQQNAVLAAPLAGPVQTIAAAVTSSRRAASALPRQNLLREQQQPPAPQSVPERAVDLPAPVANEPSMEVASVSATPQPIEPAVNSVANETAAPLEADSGSAFAEIDALRLRTATPAKQAQAEDRLEDIRHLRQTGRKRGADNAWRRFRQDFPEYPVAADDIARPREE